jgi:hypothetical protein
MISAAPWTAFLALLVIEMAVVIVVRAGIGAASAILHRHDGATELLDRPAAGHHRPLPRAVVALRPTVSDQIA